MLFVRAEEKDKLFRECDGQEGVFIVDQIIRAYFKENKLPKPVIINPAGKWASGTVYAVTCGVIKIKKYAVYCTGATIHSVRQRGI